MGAWRRSSCFARASAILGFAAASTANAQSVIASLPYDAGSTWGFPGQIFGEFFQKFDTFPIEDFSIASDANLGVFRSRGFGLGDPFAATDVIVEVWTNPLDGSLPGQGESQLVLRSLPGVGFWDGEAAVGDFGGQCLPAGCYFILWAAELEFLCCGQILFYAQAGEHGIDAGCAQANNGVLWNPRGGFGMGEYFAAVDGGVQQATGVNFELQGDLTDCDNPCNDPNGCGDWDGDADSDADDFFGFLEDFATLDPCADLDRDGDWDSDDFFMFLGRFVLPC